MYPMSCIARWAKTRFFVSRIAPGSRVLEVGSGSQWLRPHVLAVPGASYESVDAAQPATYTGDIRVWKQLGLQAESYDVIVAFELLEHVDCLSDLCRLLRPGGLLMLTSPVPHMDAFLRILERLCLLQRRTSEHTNLLYFDRVTGLIPLVIRSRGGMSQWGLFRKELTGPGVVDAPQASDGALAALAAAGRSRLPNPLPGALAWRAAPQTKQAC